MVVYQVLSLGLPVDLFGMFVFAGPIKLINTDEMAVRLLS